MSARPEEKTLHHNVSSPSLMQNVLKIVDVDSEQGESSSKVNNEIKDNSKDVLRSESIETLKKTQRSASIGSIESNRTMVFILGRPDIRLISPDRKQILLHKNFVDIANVVQGVANSEHFGIICNEKKEGKTEFIGYVFKCQSGSIAHDIMTSVTKSLETLQEQAKIEEEEKNNIANILTCEHCPMIWFNKLCNTIEGMNDKKTYSTIMKFIEELNDEDHEIIMQKFLASDKVSDFALRERNKFLIALIEAHCQMRQQRHVHDTMENRSEFLNQYLGGSTIFMKAKRSLSNSFDHLLKRRGSKDLVDGNLSDSDDQKRMKPMRSMSLAPNSPQTLTFKEPSSEPINTSKMDM